MSDEEVAALLRSDEQIVVIEAPAGCGKTFQAAAYARGLCKANIAGKLLVLTHTHAACSVISTRTQNMRDKIEILTIDSLIFQIATAYRLPLNLPEDIATWVRQNSYEELAIKTAAFLKIYPFITKHLASLYPFVLCDEHQDASGAQDEIIQLIGNAGAKLRIFGDPMQIIPGGRGQDATVAEAQARWEELKAKAAFAELKISHRWQNTNPALGEWILKARLQLGAGEPITLPENPIDGLNVLFAENGAQHNGQQYRLQTDDWPRLNAEVNSDSSKFILAKNNNVVKALRSAFGRRVPIWEGHTRKYVDQFIENLTGAAGDPSRVTDAFIECLQNLMVGFSNTEYANRLRSEIRQITPNPRGEKPPELKQMAAYIIESPCHKGTASAAQHLRNLIRTNAPGFTDLKIDLSNELSDIIKLRDVDDLTKGWIELNRRRSRSFPKPSRKSLSTIHKAKGLEKAHVMLMGCDAQHFSNGAAKRNLLYVGMSRATHQLTIVVSQNNPSPLIQL